MAFKNEQLIQIYQQLHQIPELGLEEFETHQFLLTTIHQMNQENLEYRTTDKLPTALVVKVNGNKHTKRIGYRTDIDGLPIVEQTGLAFASKTNGRMHACGHDIHMTVALGILDYFADYQPEYDLIFIFQPSEENHSGGKKLYQSGILDDWMPD